MKYNLHTHSFYCGHGEGKIEDYASYAEEKGFELLGFSEHAPFPDNIFHSTRMNYSQISDYLADVDRARERHNMTILKGFECDYLPAYKDYFEDLREHVDYLITGTHYMISDYRISNPFDGSMTKEDLFIYANSTIKAMESGLFSFVCHPDVFLSHYPFDEDAKSVSRDIITLSVELNLPLEVNANGIAKSHNEGLDYYRYPRKEFFSLASSLGAVFVKNSDAHKVANLDKYSAELDAFIKELDLDMLEPKAIKEGERYKLTFEKDN